MTPGAFGASGCLLGVSWVPLGVSREGWGGEGWGEGGNLGKSLKTMENCRESMHLNRVWATVFLSFFFPPGGPELKRFFIVFVAPGFGGQQKW